MLFDYKQSHLFIYLYFTEMTSIEALSLKTAKQCPPNPFIAAILIFCFARQNDVCDVPPFCKKYSSAASFRFGGLS